jgi:hypothetical protein
VIGDAGRQRLDREELLRAKDRDRRGALCEAWVPRGRGFVGEHDRETRMPLPDHISERPEDLPALGNGMIAFDHGPAQAMHTVIAAAVHHTNQVLARNRAAKPELLAPASSAGLPLP